MKRKIRRSIFIYALFQIIFISILINGCSKKREDLKLSRLELRYQMRKINFISYIFSEMEEQQKSYGNKIEVVYLDAKEDEEKQKEQVKYFIEQGMDAVIVSTGRYRLYE